MELLDQAVEVLFFLESIDWKWDIRTLLAQPSDLFEAVLKLLVAGRKQKKQNEKQVPHE